MVKLIYEQAVDWCPQPDVFGHVIPMGGMGPMQPNLLMAFDVGTVSKMSNMPFHARSRLAATAVTSVKPAAMLFSTQQMRPPTHPMLDMALDPPRRESHQDSSAHATVMHHGNLLSSVWVACRQFNEAVKLFMPLCTHLVHTPYQ
jgi:hypothetical protein